MSTTDLPVDGREMLGSFRDRLADAIGRADMSQVAFARRAGIDRSTLSQLLSEKNARLPRVETLVALARSTGVSVDWLLGLSQEGAIKTDIVKEQLSVSRHDLSPLDEALIGWYQDAVGMKVRYVPSTLPDLLKTEAVIHHEVTRYETTRPEQRIETAEAPLVTVRVPGSDVECCNSIQALEGFARGHEIWGTLDPDARIEQLDRMIELCEELYPTFRWFLYDGRQRYAGPITVFGTQRAVIYLGQMYLVLNSQDHVLEFMAQFDDLIRAAVVQPPEVPDVLRRLRAEITQLAG